MLSLSKRLPARTKTIKFLWLKEFPHPYSERFETIRRNDRMCRCHWCQHHFEIGEKMVIGCIEGQGNRMFCQDCAAKTTGEDRFVPAAGMVPRLSPPEAASSLDPVTPLGAGDAGIHPYDDGPG